jgi:hypothetical protein
MAIILTGSTGVATPAVTDASGGNTATINSMTPTADSLQGFRNRIINGDMRIDQRNAGAAVTVNGAAAYTVDRWFGEDVTDGVFTVQQDSSAPTGFNFSAKITTTTADASLAAGQYAVFTQRIEGFNTADLMWGTANAKTVTLSFWVRSSLTGTFGGVLANSAENYSYPFTYSISAANTWEQKSVTVTGPTAGTWIGATNGKGIIVTFALGSGSTYVGTAGAWAAADYRGGATGQTSVIGTLNATWYITGAQLEVGSVATPFERRDYGRELIMCQRYYYLHTSFAETNYGVIGIGYNYTASQMNTIVYFPVTMRIAPTLTATSGTDYYVFERNGADDFLNSLTISGATPKTAGVNNSSQISGTAGQAGRLITYTSGASVAFNAEL